jgi:multidrug efflux system membrane fusion protein
LFARVRIGSADTAEALLIHPTAVGTDLSKKFVMVVGEGSKAEYREVTLGGLVDGLQVVTSGLKAGEHIIVNGLQRARPGAPVTGSEVDMKTLAPLTSPPAAETPKQEAEVPAKEAAAAPKAN